MATIQFGILMIPFQLVDCAMPLDVLSSCSKPYLAVMEGSGVPKGTSERGIDIKFHYVGVNMDPVEHTASFSANPSCTVDNCPKLDYLLVGGPDPKYIEKMPQEFIKFIQERTKEVKTVFTTCTGGMVIAATGVLDGVEATTNHAVLPIAQEMLPKVRWTKEKQWVISEGGKFWTAGGASAGMDMVAHWVIQEYGMDVAVCGFMALDYHPRGLDKKLIDLPEVK